MIRTGHTAECYRPKAQTTAKSFAGIMQRVVKVAFDTAEEEYICTMACGAEKAFEDGHPRWDSIRKLQMARAGPNRPIVVLKESGDLKNGQDEVKSQWHKNFMKILSTPSEY